MSGVGNVQPEGGGEAAGEGQGESSGFYQEYLNQVPEDYRAHVEPYLKNIETNANKRFSEHADYKKQWEPYEELGLTDYEPDSIQELIQFAEVLQNPEQFKEWFLSAGQQTGILDELLGSDGDDEDYEDYDTDDDDLDPEAVQQFFDQMLEQKLAPILEKQYESDYQEQVEQAESQIDEQLDSLASQHSVELDEDSRKMICQFAYAYSDQEGADPIAMGFADWAKYTGQIEQGTVERKVNQPPPAEGESRPNTTPQAIKTFSGAQDAAKARYAQLRSGS